LDASARVLKKRAAHSHLSMRTEFMPPFSYKWAALRALDFAGLLKAVENGESLTLSFRQAGLAKPRKSGIA
jgi:hypothetical protein